MEPERKILLEAQEAETCNNPTQPGGVDVDFAAVFTDHPRYRILAPLGAGGMGAVYKAEHKLMERVVALKIIKPQLLHGADAVERFRREIKAAAQLNHANIVTAHDADQVGDSHFLVMEHVEGVSLARHLREQGRLNVVQACEFARQVAMGLQHAHDKGMVHRDIKPANLMLTPQGQVKILDFGLARMLRETTSGEGLTPESGLMGTPDFIAPEQASNPRNADIRADIYSLGCTLYCLLAGRVPFPGGTTVQKIMAHMETPPPPLRTMRNDIAAELESVLARMMAKDPAHRFPTPASVAKALEPFTKGQTAPRPPALKPVGGASKMVSINSLTQSGAPSQVPRQRAAPPAVPISAPAAGQPVRRRRALPWVLLGAAATFLILTAIIVLVVGRGAPAQGALTVTADDAGLEIVIKMNGTVVVSRTARREFTIPAGGQGEIISYEPGVDQPLGTKRFSLASGGKLSVRVP